MKICYLSDASSIHTKKICEFFKNKGYEVHVISLNYGKIDGATVHSLNVSKTTMNSNKITQKLKYLKFFLKVKKLVKNQIKPDILHAHYATSYGLLGRLCRYHPYIISVWGSDIFDFPKGGTLKRNLLMRNLKSADIIMSTSGIMAKETKLYTDKDIQITPFGVDTSIYKPTDYRYDKKDNIIIGTVKALENIYGIDNLIKAFSEVNKKYDNLKLEIAGGGSKKDYLVNLCRSLDISDKVQFLGIIDRESVVAAFNRFDISVFPSIEESFGVAAVEAQACGSALIVSDAGGLLEATEPGVTSIVVEKGNVEQLAEAMDRLISNHDLRVNMGKEGVLFVHSKYDINDNFEEINNTYLKITN